MDEIVRMITFNRWKVYLKATVAAYENFGVFSTDTYIEFILQDLFVYFLFF